MIEDHPLRGRVAAMATLHDKAVLVAPAMVAHVGMHVRETHPDTNVLGTFAGEIPRPCPPLDAAVTKAKMAMERTGSGIGLGSEGIIGPHPMVPFIVCDTEIIACVFGEPGVVVHESVTMTGVPGLTIDLGDDHLSEEQFDRAGFPEHGLLVRPVGGYRPVFKGIHDREELNLAIRECSMAPGSGEVRIETDFRANHHPTRRSVIASAAEALARRLAARCPDCRTPGWGRSRIEYGAPCRVCGWPTSAPLTEVHGCVSCRHESVVVVAPVDGVDAGECGMCNP